MRSTTERIVALILLPGVVLLFFAGFGLLELRHGKLYLWEAPR